MTTVRVLGGSGYLGRRVVAALSALRSLTVQSASRRGDVRVDVSRPETFAALDDSDVIVDVSDATTTAPDELIEHLLSRGVTVIETTSDPRCIERLHRRFRGTNGRLILGCGIFTGVSNLLARAASRDVGEAERVRLAISSSPFSGAGAGTIELMVEGLRTPVVTWEAGARIERASMTKGPRVDFGAASRPTLVAPFAETYMLRESTGAGSVEVLFSPRPAPLVPAFLWTPSWVGRTRWGRALMRGYFTALRRWALSRVASEVELYALAEARGARSERRVVARDGMMAAAWAAAAMTERALADRQWTGVRFIDDLCELEPTLARANELAGEVVLRELPR
jgi:hypothetical protein